MKKIFKQFFLLGLAVLFLSPVFAGKEGKLGKFKLEQIKPNDPDAGRLSKMESIKEALEWRSSLLQDENGQVLPEYYTNAIARADQMRASAGSLRSVPLAWQNLGPDNVGGRTRAILFDKRDPSRNTIYAGAVGGGMWKSLDKGEHWSQILTVNQCLAVSCIAQDLNGNIYFGTGEGLAQPGGTSRNSGTVGNGLHLLHDNDLDSVLPSTIPAVISNNTQWCMINRIAINPTNASDMYVATSGGTSQNNGLQHSTDGGQTWTLIGTSAAPVSGLRTTYEAAADVKFSANGNYIFATIGISGGTFPGVTLIMSQDGGATWTAPANSSFPSYPNGVARIEIAVAPSDENTVYIVVVNSNGDMGGVYKSIDAGNTWSLVGPPGGVLSNCYGTTSFGQGWYDNVIAVNPRDPDKVIIGGTQLFSYSSRTGGWNQSTIYFGDPSNSQWVHADMHAIVYNDLDSNQFFVGCDGGIFRCDDAFDDFPGINYQVKNRGYGVTQMYSVAADHFGDVLGGAQDNGTSYINYRNGAPTYAINVYGGDGPYAEISHFDPSIFIGGYVEGQDYRSNTYGTAWVPMYDGVINPGNSSDQSSNNDPSVCGQALGGNAAFVGAFWLDETTNAYNSIDSVSFLDSTATHYAGEVLNFTSRIKQPFSVTLTDSIPKGQLTKFVDPLKARLYYATTCGLWMTPDILDFANTPRWFHITANNGDAKSLTYTPTGDTIYFANYNSVERITGLNSVLAFDTAAKGHKDILLYTGAHCQDTLIHVTSSGGQRFIEGIDVDLNNPNHVLCAVAGYSTSAGEPHVYHSMDAGLTWSPVQGSGAGQLPNMPVYQCVIDYYNPNHYIIGSELGVWDSYDNGTTWQEENDSIFRVPVFRLRQQDYFKTGCYVLYIGTHGRGMWRCATLTTAAGCTVYPLAVNEVKGDENTMMVYPNPLSSAGGRIKLNLEKSSDLTVKVIDMPGRIIEENSYAHLPSGNNELQLNTANMPTGTYLVVATLSNGQMMTRRIVVSTNK